MCFYNVIWAVLVLCCLKTDTTDFYLSYNTQCNYLNNEDKQTNTTGIGASIAIETRTLKEGKINFKASHNEVSAPPHHGDVRSLWAGLKG